MKFDSLYKYHDHVYVLTIPRAKERHKSILEEFPGWNLDFFMGMDKKDVTFDKLIQDGIIDITKTSHIDLESGSREGFICCSYGHRKIYEDMLLKGYRKVLILEDDVLKNNISCDYVDRCLSHIPKDAELLYWGWANGVVQNLKWPYMARKISFYLKSGLGMMKKFESIYEGKYAIPYNRYFDTASIHTGAYAYTITNSCAEKFVKLQTPINFYADELFMHCVRNNLIKSYISKRALFVDATYFGHKKYLPSLIEY